MEVLVLSLTQQILKWDKASFAPSPQTAGRESSGVGWGGWWWKNAEDLLLPPKPHPHLGDSAPPLAKTYLLLTHKVCLGVHSTLWGERFSLRIVSCSGAIPGPDLLR